MKVSFLDRLQFTKTAIVNHNGLFLIMAILLLASTILIYSASQLENITATITFYGIGGVTLFMFFILAITTFPSFLFYYEQALIKKYGTYMDGTVINKIIEDHSYQEQDDRSNFVEELHYIIQYKFEYNSTSYENEFHVKEACYNAIKIGSTIPIKILKTNPHKATTRRRKLSSSLGLANGSCS